VPKHIVRPPYANNNNKNKNKKKGWYEEEEEEENDIMSKGNDEQNWETMVERKDEPTRNKMRVAGRLAKKVLDFAGSLVAVGVTTNEIDAKVHEMIIRHNAYPSPLHYQNFPKSICTSVNNVLCHGVPDDRPLQDGDIVNIDVTVFIGGVHGDCSKTFLVGNVDPQAQKLVKVTEECVEKAIATIGPGKRLILVGQAIEDVAQREGYGVFVPLCGHGIGKIFHDLPIVSHVPIENFDMVLSPGMTFTIEPILLEDRNAPVDRWPDGAVVARRGWAAQHEHTVLITETGVEVLTK
jgi:methionyl aminopeptidase